jgi:hypothetical protein
VAASFALHALHDSEPELHPQVRYLGELWDPRCFGCRLLLHPGGSPTLGCLSSAGRCEFRAAVL